MRVLVIGKGGREHAIVWKLKQSKLVKDIFIATGNGGICRLGHCLPIDPLDIDGLVKFALENQIDFTVVGPEDPLAAGIIDEFEKWGLDAFGPSRRAAQLEAEKAFAKDFMRRYGIPTGEFEIFDSAKSALAYIRKKGVPIVVKASGLAAGKGTFVLTKKKDVERVIDGLMVEKRLGKAGERVVVEEFLSGYEVSVFALVDGQTIMYLPSAQDHKRLLDRDRGPNTGGMGAYAPFTIDPKLMKFIDEVIVKPTIWALSDNDIIYQGVLYCGLIITANGPRVLEYNVRFGDPEAQVILPLIETDLMTLLLATRRKELHGVELKLADRYAVCVILASKGYPEKYEKGFPITIRAKESEDLVIFHAGTIYKDGEFLTNGGRVLGVTGIDKTLKGARNRAYQAIEKIGFENMYYRKDIGAYGLRRTGG
ncbi:phosphoribosylamine--glycine ligase [candidate division WOR-3 bacterium]|uniref:Phosphoribosylamine--glycine ligase n=1 Tax=candidate division WOR-3 bacterium TaxID=2052148 RepID=A0A660SI64_UNCW3|nr:MAG: phosphoribosylamine--glycine ligase [candidate division WOR-3 bacterium]